MKVKSFAVLFFILINLFISPLLFSQVNNQDSGSWYIGKPLKDIVFSGLKNIKLSEIEALMNPYKGQIFTDDLFAEILGKLYALEYFDTIDPATIRADSEGTEVVLRFSVTERPIVRRINFIGNSGVRRHELNEAITTKVSDVFNQAKLKADIEAIRLKYLEKGYPNVTITVDENHSADGVILNFRITESEKISILRIDFEGNSRFTVNTLRNQLSLKARTLVNAGAFQEAKLLADREAIEKYYRDRGYVDAVVRDVTRTYGTDKKGTNLILTFMIEEGEEYRFGGFEFEGNRIFTDDQLQKLVSSKKGDVLNSTRVEMDLQRVIDLYLENGYFSNSMDSSSERDPETNTIVFKLEIVERNRAYIESISVVGNEKSKDYVILREIPLEAGDVFSKTKIMEAWRNLMNLQYFTMVFPETMPGSEENLMELVVNVEEQQTITLQFGLTFSGSSDPDSFPISGMVEWTDRNIFGTGNEFGVKLVSSIVYNTDISVNYLHRWIFGLPLSLGVDLSASYSQRRAPTDNDMKFYGDEGHAYPDGFSSYEEYIYYDKIVPNEFLMRYNQWYLSLGLSTGYRWHTIIGNVGINGGFRFGMIHNSYSGDSRPFDVALRDGRNRWTPKNSFWTSFSIDQRDIFYDPSSGYFFNQRFGLYGFFNDENEHYIRSDTRAQYYYTLFNIPVRWTEKWSFKSVFAVHGSLSFLFGQPWRNDDPRRLPIEEANKLSVDGMFVGRGWSGEFRNKGLLLLDTWAELRFPVVPGILAWDFFFDMAGVESKDGFYFGDDDIGNPNFTKNNLRFSFGGGFRFTMPQFPIRLSVAKRFRFVDDEFTWMRGALFGDRKNPARGVDLVISFAIAY